jgi:4-hydroxy-tetrahydrodipicolinate synthase
MFKGAITAIVTPFKEDGSLDLEALKQLVNFQIENNIDGIVPCGTTGESPTLDGDEDVRVTKAVIEAANNKVKIIAGAGSNNTKHAAEMTKAMADIGVDATLQVNPYYNKPTQEGLFRHFSAVAKATDKPVVVYNIKGRTGVNVETATLARLQKEHSNIVAVKEASGDINQVQDVINTLPKEFDVLSGDDTMTIPLIKLGGKGVVSVASNIIPNDVKQLTEYALNGDMEKAEVLHNRLLPLFEGLFVETNPIPIKAALAMKGMIKETYRLPMCEMRPSNKEKLKQLLTQMKII